MRCTPLRAGKRPAIGVARRRTPIRQTSHLCSFVLICGPFLVFFTLVGRPVFHSGAASDDTVHLVYGRAVHRLPTDGSRECSSRPLSRMVINAAAAAAPPAPELHNQARSPEGRDDACNTKLDSTIAARDRQVSRGNAVPSKALTADGFWQVQDPESRCALRCARVWRPVFARRSVM